jgi:histidinol-phosphate aminotransferase
MTTPQARQAVQRLVAYAPPQENRASFTRLDFNENTHADLDLAMYPEYQELISSLASHWKLLPSQILPTNGSDEALMIIPQTYIEPRQDSAIILNPTFSMIPLYLKLVEANIVEIPVTPSLNYDIGAISDALEKQAVKLAVFPSPDNPTGATLNLEQLSLWCQSFPETLFVLDEAYAEYQPEETHNNSLGLLKQHCNLLITRTFSKAWGLAGLRLGVILGHPQQIAILNRVRSPFSVNSAAVKEVLRLLPQAQRVLETAQRVLETKASTLKALQEQGYKVHAGGGNFFLLHLGKEATAFCEYCQTHRLLLRDRSALPALFGSIRITVGTPSEMEGFRALLHAFYQGRALIFDLDDTLIDTSQSYDATVISLIERLSQQPYSRQELLHLKESGGFNDDWDATEHILEQRGVSVNKAELIQEAQSEYFRIAPLTETPLLALSILTQLKKRYGKLLIATGRPRHEFDVIWAEKLNPYFDQVLCQDDVPGMPKKPHPGLLQHLIETHDLQSGLYVGNSVDDMRAAKAAGLVSVGISHTHSKASLLQAGADFVLESLSELQEIFAV